MHGCGSVVSHLNTFDRHLRNNRRSPGVGERSASSNGGNGKLDHQLAETNKVATARPGRTRKSQGGKTHETNVLGLGRKAPERKSRGIPSLEGAQGPERGRVDDLSVRGMSCNCTMQPVQSAQRRPILFTSKLPACGTPADTSHVCVSFSATPHTLGARLPLVG